MFSFARASSDGSDAIMIAMRMKGVAEPIDLLVGRHLPPSCRLKSEPQARDALGRLPARWQHCRTQRFRLVR